MTTAGTKSYTGRVSLDAAHDLLGWPTPGEILAPSGAGPAVQAELARQKIQQSLRRLPGAQDVRVGILARDSTADATEEPLAVVCEFRSNVPARTLAEAHRLAWNFCRSKLVMVVEPHLVRAWTCCEPPPRTPPLGDHPAEILKVDLAPSATPSLADQAARSLHWLRLVSGDFVRSYSAAPTVERPRFADEGRADRLLLANLKAVRDELLSDAGVRPALAKDVAHDLIARVIFIQFLFHRKDGSGRPALGEPEMQRLHARRILSAPHKTLRQILLDYADAYRLFRWLNSKFNGDLFPGKGATKAQQEAEWRAEMAQVKPAHLQLLAHFVEGKLRLKGKSKQLDLWPFYSFDAIPIEFISSIYEEFVGDKPGVHYTPGYLVDFILDGALPWDGDKWDLRVLDPACGSGIFLVKVFQRLVHRWRSVHRDEAPRAALLKRILTRNLFGVDLDEHAVRVASFSLYLAMCDEIDPRHYWNRMRFPRLRGVRLIHADFFEERKGFHTGGDAKRYDLVTGNAPWGQDSVTKFAEEWARAPKNSWPLVNKGIGTLFLAKAAELARPDGTVAMMTSASSLLFNRETTAQAFRAKLFAKYSFAEVINLSAVRFGIFPRVKSAACIVVFQPAGHAGDAFSYICPKPTANMEPGDWLVIEPGDVQAIYPDEAASDPWVWTALLWGGRRDLALVHRLAHRSTKKPAPAKGRLRAAASDDLTRLDQLDDEVLHKRLGIIRGDRLKPEPPIVGRRILEMPEFPAETFLHLRVCDFPRNDDPATDGKSSRTMTPFDLPQMIIKKGWSASTKRFSAVLTEGDSATGGLVCTQAYVSVHVPEAWLALLESACLSLNSVVAVYYLFLTSGRAAFIPDALVEDLMSVPLAPPTPELLSGLKTFAEVDSRMRTALQLNEAEWILIEDFANHTVGLIQDANSAGWRTRVERDADSSDTDLVSYCECFLRVLHDGMGARAAATVFRGEAPDALPIHLIAVYLNHPATCPVEVEPIRSDELLARLLDLNRLLRGRSPGAGGVFFQRTARIYDTADVGGVRVPVVYVAKPRALRYWTRATALRDADDVVADAALWAAAHDHAVEETERE